MKQLTLESMRILALLLIGAAACFAQPRVDKIIDGDWKFTRENAPNAESVQYRDDHWETIALPHTWNARDGQDGGNDYYRGVGWYRKTVRIDPKHRGKSFFLRFDGAGTKAQVFVNGSPAGSHKGSFGAFCFDVTSLMNVGTANLIAVKVNNALDTTVAPLRGDFTMFGGIYRSVHLLILDNLSISPLDFASPGVYITQTRVDSGRADVAITTVLRNGTAGERSGIVRSSVLDDQGRVVHSVNAPFTIPPNSTAADTQQATIRSPHLWNGVSDPYLYAVKVELLEGNRVRDCVTQPLGLRSFAVDADRGFFLNGRPYPLHGVNRHQDRQDKGWAIGLREHQEDFALIAEMGCTAVRLAHYQQAQEFYDLCDRGGMVVWAELALVDEVRSSPEFAANCRAQLTELIKQSYNHPSIMFWSIYNELMPDSDRGLYNSIVADLNAVAKRLDPSRLTAMASRSKYAADEFINTVSDVIGYNVYRGWYEGSPDDFARFVDTLHAQVPTRRLCISEYGAGGSPTQHEIPPKKPPTKGPWHPEEWQSTLHEVTWKAMAERPYLWGTFVWNMFDFASDGRSEGLLPGRNDKGLVTFDRKIRKDAFFWYKANWSAQPMVHIASKRFSPRPEGVTEVRVYANCDSVILSVNGTSLGSRSSADRIFLWSDVRLAPGSNAVEAIGYARGKVTRDSCSWIGTELKGEASR